MSQHKSPLRGRTFLAGKIISNFGQSTIDCTVRRISDQGATVEVESPVGVPKKFHLLIPGEGEPRPCKLVWQSEHQLGIEFDSADAMLKVDARETSDPEYRSAPVVRSQMLALRSALDEVDVGIVLFDSELRAQFINRAFRAMWNLPDTMADRKPAFAALMHHGRETNAYQVAQAEIDNYIADRVRLVTSGDVTPLDLRRSNGEVVRMQCAVLPNGGRMLSYTVVTDIVRQADELNALKRALDNVEEGIVLLDADLHAQFLNRKMRQFWGVTDQEAAAHPSYAELIASAPHAGHHVLKPAELSAFFASRVAAVQAPESSIRDLQTADGRHIRAHCAVLENGGRMLTYCDVSDLVRNAEEMEKLATIDSLTGLHNRRHFLALAEAEWSRFQRYHRPLSMLMIDIDHFKSVNDRFGHAVGDDAIRSIANACQAGKRSPDVVGRLGGEEFGVLLPETELAQARIVANRIRKNAAGQSLKAHKVQFYVTVSVGVAAATASMPGIDPLMKAADPALYRAKAEGRNRTALWSPPHTPKLAAE